MDNAIKAWQRLTETRSKKIRRADRDFTRSICLQLQLRLQLQLPLSVRAEVAAECRCLLVFTSLHNRVPPFNSTTQISKV